MLKHARTHAPASKPAQEPPALSTRARMVADCGRTSRFTTTRRTPGTGGSVAGQQQKSNDSVSMHVWRADHIAKRSWRERERETTRLAVWVRAHTLKAQQQQATQCSEHHCYLVRATTNDNELTNRSNTHTQRAHTLTTAQTSRQRRTRTHTHQPGCHDTHRKTQRPRRAATAQAHLQGRVDSLAREGCHGVRGVSQQAHPCRRRPSPPSTKCRSRRRRRRCPWRA